MKDLATQIIEQYSSYLISEKIIEKLMYKILSNFLDISSLIYSSQPGFQQKYSTSYALINLTESIRQNLDEGCFGCGKIVDLQKTPGTVIIKVYCKN